MTKRCIDLNFKWGFLKVQMNTSIKQIVMQEITLNIVWGTKTHYKNIIVILRYFLN